MRIKDMTLAMEQGTHLAVESKRGTVLKAIVTGVRQERRVFSGARWDMSGHIARDGVKVKFVEGDPPNPRIAITEAGDEYVVPPKDVLMPWDAYTVKAASKADAEAARQERLAQEKERAERVIERFGAGHVKPIYGTGKEQFIVKSYGVMLNAAAVHFTPPAEYALYAQPLSDTPEWTQARVDRR